MELESVYPRCARHLGEAAWRRLSAAYDGVVEDAVAEFASWLERQRLMAIPPYLPDLARLEWACWQVKGDGREIGGTERLRVNPCLQLLSLSWRLLPEFGQDEAGEPLTPRPGRQWALIWRNRAGRVRCEPAGGEDLFALKLVAQELDRFQAARASGVSPGTVNQVLQGAVEKEILLAPPSRLRRRKSKFPACADVPRRFLSSAVFSLQWHITNACELHCRHCYDRSQPSPLPLAEALGVLDELYEFCRRRFVQGHVSFTGGNPFLYPHFEQLYRAGAERGFLLSILGNPVGRERLEPLLEIQKPQFFQVSLEGLPEYNDKMRGEGHYQRVMEFLPLLRRLGVYATVMLTLTRDNIGQVLPLAERLRERGADSFTFNRLSRVGEGTDLALPEKKSYLDFLVRYVQAASHNPILHYKDNLLNVLAYKNGEALFGGCTGFGCGAAFNFLVLLPDGQVHACRKFPSPLGDIRGKSLSHIYDSPLARKYRDGCRACKDCPIRYACGSCLAMAHSFGLDVFARKDPHCFIASPA